VSVRILPVGCHAWVRGDRARVNEGASATLDVLVTRLAAGDRGAFSPVFERLWPPTLRLCKSILRNDADASDAAQEALAKILTRASDYDSSRPALPWAMAIASWECRTILRKRDRRRESDAPPVGIASLEPSVEDRNSERELIESALTALGTLSPTDQETLLATFREEAASASGATLRKRRERALTRLRLAFRRLYGLD
jgi:RNA polymerase sigma-70 factor, ECF subfamily